MYWLWFCCVEGAVISGRVVEQGGAISAPFVGGTGDGGGEYHIQVALMHRVDGADGEGAAHPC